MNVIKFHEDAVVFNGLIVSNWSRELFEDMCRGGPNGHQLHMLCVGGFP
jgi:hypothetical protein